jgi:Protein of unknown function (DUF2934)
MKAVSFELIQRRAYEIWERDGAPHGLDQEHWAQAERELLDAAPESVEARPRAATPPQREEIRKVAAGVAEAARERANAARAP